MHEERLPSSKRLLGVQPWLNLAAKDKMAAPSYVSLKADQIKEVALPGGLLRVLAGSYEGENGYQGKYQPLDYYDIHLDPHSSLTLKSDPLRSIMLFALLGSIAVENVLLKEKTSVKLSEGDSLTIQTKDEKTQILFVSSIALKETVAWGEPIVMNTREELYKAFQELDEGTFIRQRIKF